MKKIHPLESDEAGIASDMWTSAHQKGRVYLLPQEKGRQHGRNVDPDMLGTQTFSTHPEDIFLVVPA